MSLLSAVNSYSWCSQTLGPVVVSGSVEAGEKIPAAPYDTAHGDASGLARSPSPHGRSGLPDLTVARRLLRIAEVVDALDA